MNVSQIEWICGYRGPLLWHLSVVLSSCLPYCFELTRELGLRSTCLTWYVGLAVLVSSSTCSAWYRFSLGLNGRWTRGSSDHARILVHEHRWVQRQRGFLLQSTSLINVEKWQRQERGRNRLLLPCGGLSCPSVSRRTSSKPSSLRGCRSLDKTDTLLVSTCSSLSATSPFCCELTALSCSSPCGGACCDSLGMATASGGCWWSPVGVVADVSIPVFCVVASLCTSSAA